MNFCPKVKARKQKKTGGKNFEQLLPPVLFV